MGFYEKRTLAVQHLETNEANFREKLSGWTTIYQNLICLYDSDFAVHFVFFIRSDSM